MQRQNGPNGTVPFPVWDTQKSEQTFQFGWWVTSWQCELRKCFSRAPSSVIFLVQLRSPQTWRMRRNARVDNELFLG